MEIELKEQLIKDVMWIKQMSSEIKKFNFNENEWIVLVSMLLREQYEYDVAKSIDHLNRSKRTFKRTNERNSKTSKLKRQIEELEDELIKINDVLQTTKDELRRAQGEIVIF
jgi:hypothetical protein